MFKIINRSTTHLSIGGADLAPKQCMVVQEVGWDLKYLQKKNALSIQIIKNPVSPTTIDNSKTVVSSEHVVNVDEPPRRRGRPKLSEE